MTPLIQTFTHKLEANMGRVYNLDSLKKVPEAVLGIAKKLEFGAGMVAAGTKDLHAISWGKIPVDFREPKETDTLGITQAQFGIAETGSLVFASSKESPAALNFVPEYSIVVLGKKDILPASEDIWAAFLKKGKMPRTLNIVSGPSKTGDIEQTLYLGAHGPRELHVLLV